VEHAKRYNILVLSSVRPRGGSLPRYEDVLGSKGKGKKGGEKREYKTMRVSDPNVWCNHQEVWPAVRNGIGGG